MSGTTPSGLHVAEKSVEMASRSDATRRLRTAWYVANEPDVDQNGLVMLLAGIGLIGFVIHRRQPNAWRY